MDEDYKSDKYGVNAVIQTRDGDLATIVGRVGDQYVVEIDDENKAKSIVSARQIDRGNIVNPYSKTAFDVGYIGEGDYDIVGSSNAYMAWLNMMNRCYGPNRASDDFEVARDWHNFQAFARWFHENVVDEFVLDSRLIGGNIYSKNNCLFIPQAVGAYLNRRDSMREDVRIKKCIKMRSKLSKYGFSDYICDKLN